MSRLYLNPDHIMKQEQYQDLLRQAKRRRLIKAVARLRPGSSRQIDVAFGETLADLIWWLADIWPISRARA